jgi:hypothetical protein
LEQIIENNFSNEKDESPSQHMPSQMQDEDISAIIPRESDLNSPEKQSNLQLDAIPSHLEPESPEVGDDPSLYMGNTAIKKISSPQSQEQPKSGMYIDSEEDPEEDGEMTDNDIAIAWD